jgi:hypothetical protein
VPTFQSCSESEDLTRNLRVSNWTRFSETEWKIVLFVRAAAACG